MSVVPVSTILLFFAVAYLFFTSLILLRNRFELTPLAGQKLPNGEAPVVTVCIPARNEESTIGKLLESLLHQDYSHFEILVLDDHSEDGTAKAVQHYMDSFNGRLTLLKGKEKPVSWLGKPWACQQLGESAHGDLILFLDADVTLEKGALRYVAATFMNQPVDMITVWPRQILSTFWEKSVIPLVYFALLTLLPSIYVWRSPRWMPKKIAPLFREAFSAANGQCIAFRAESYRKIGGHQAVCNQIVEDVALARAIKMAGYRVRMYEGCGSVSCRMYSSEPEMFAGFRKNFLAGFGYSLPLFLASALLHLVVFLFPWLMLIHSLVFGNSIHLWLSATALSLTLMQRLLLAVWFRWDPLYSLLHPLGVLWFQRLGLQVLLDHVTGTKALWKGRKI